LPLKKLAVPNTIGWAGFTNSTYKKLAAPVTTTQGDNGTTSG